MAALPYATGAGFDEDSGLAPFVVPPELLAQRKAIEARMNAPRAPTYTPEQQQQRRADNEREYNLGLLAQLSGDSVLSPVGGSILKNAIEGAKTRTTERGTVDPISGRFTYDPDYLAQRDETALAGWDTNVGKLRGDWDKAQQSAADRRAMSRERDETRRMIASMRPAGGGGSGKFDLAGYSPDGQPIVFDKSSAMQYTLSQGPDGKPVYTPALGTAVVPKNTWDKQVQDSQESLAGATRARGLLQKASANPKAFSAVYAANSLLPGSLQGYGASVAGMPAEVRELRAGLARDAAMELNRIYGAAQSAGELKKAVQFAYDARDPLETTLSKLKSAVEWEESRAAGYGPGVRRAAAARSGVPAPGAAAPAAPGAPGPAAGGDGWGIKRK